MTLASIIAATVLGGVVSMLAAAALALGTLSRMVRQMVSLSVGMLLGTAVLHLLPDAFQSGADTRALAWTLLAGLVGFFVLEKLAILRHSHHHEGDGHAHHHGHDRREAGPAGMAILVGDTIHNFSDGVLIAAAFLADSHLGWVTTAAIAAHEVPQEIGDFIVLLNAGYARRRAFVYNLVASLGSIVGGVTGYFALSRGQALLPYVIVLAAASFIYIALADLVPDMHRQQQRRASILQFALMMLGIALIAALTARFDGA